MKILIKRFSKHKYLETYTVEERRKMWPAVKALRSKHINHCRFLENRRILLEHMPKQESKLRRNRDMAFGILGTNS
jgi:hypothetical protein